MQFIRIGLELSIGWRLGKYVTTVVDAVIANLIKRSRWYQEATSSLETVNDHNHANTVKNKIGFDIN